MALVGASYTVELLVNAIWTNVTAYVRQDPGVEITFGIQGEGATADPSNCTLIFNNTSGRFTMRNTAGAYYPYLTRGIPLRVTVGATVRYSGYVVDLRNTWIENENVVIATSVSAGVSRRMARQGPLNSTLTSGLGRLAALDPNVTGYWPIEDEPGSTSIASGLPGAPAAPLIVAPVFAAIDPGVMSKPVPDWTAASAYFNPVAGSSTSFTAGFLLTLPSSGMSGGDELFQVQVAGTAAYWKCLYSPSDGGSILLQVIANDGVTELYASTTFPHNLDGTTTYYKIEAVNDGADVDWYAGSPSIGSSGTISTRSVGAPVAASIGLGTIAIGGSAGIGHVILGDSNTVIFTYGFDLALAGYAGETVAARMTRLAAEAGVSIAVASSPYPWLLGVQSDGTALDAMREAEAADVGGILRDSLNGAGLAYLPRTARYNDQQALLTLDYASGHLTPPLAPTDDDQQLRNDVTITRVGGSSARSVLTSGALSTADYPNGVGIYQYAATLSLFTDDQLPSTASWVLALGTVDETRWPRVTVDLVKNSSLVTAFDALRPGYRVRITNLPTFSGVANVDLHVVGWVETLTAARRVVELVCVPGTPWQVFELDDTPFGELDVMRLAL